MTDDTILTKQTKDGRNLEFRLDASASSTIAVYLDGKLLAQGRPVRLPKPHPQYHEITHMVGGKVGITATEAAQLKQAIDAADEAWYETHPQPARTLREQREDLVIRMNDLGADGEVAYWRAHAQERVDCHAIKARYDNEAEAVRQELAAFDAAHPEIIATIRAERAEAAERFARSN